MSDFRNTPWEVADGIVVCQGGSDTGPGPILFVLRAPMGTSKPYPHELLAEYADTIVQAVNNHEALVKALEFIRDGYDNQDVNHVDFRVKAYQVACDVLTDLIGASK